jgi:NAD kinase
VFHTVGIVSKLNRKQAMQLASSICETLDARRLQVKLETSLAKQLSRPSLATPIEKMKTDLVITIGGDGTILRTCLELPKPEPPILAINMGSRGFLTEVSPKNAIAAVNQTLKGEYRLEHITTGFIHRQKTATRCIERGFDHVVGARQTSQDAHMERRPAGWRLPIRRRRSSITDGFNRILTVSRGASR